MHQSIDPPINTIRLIRPGDEDCFLQLINENRDHLKNYFPITLEECPDFDSVRSFIVYKCKYADKKQGYYFVIEQENKIIGVLGIKYVNIPESKAEIAYFVDERYQGKGIITAGIKFLKNYCVEELGIKKIIAKLDHSNIGSIKVLEKNNFHYELTVVDDYTSADGIKKNAEQYAYLHSVSNTLDC